MVVHGGSGKHSLRDTAILHSQRNITWVLNMHIRIKEDNEKKEREKEEFSRRDIHGWSPIQFLRATIRA